MTPYDPENINPVVDEDAINESVKEAQAEAKLEYEPVDEALPEAPLSINIGSYYKGFYVGWTKRSADREVSDKIKSIKRFVESLVDEGFEPSWNKQTSKAALNPDSIMEVTQEVNSHPCKTCGGFTEFKSGKAKTGREWKGYFCQADKEHVEWIR
jgi:hypothetical protein